MEQGTAIRQSRKKSPAVRILAALLALYAAAGMCASAAALAKTAKQLQTLRQSLLETASEIDAVQRELEARPDAEAVRRQAFRKLSMAGPEDIVFFDGG